MLPEIKKCADNEDIRGLRYIFDDCLDVDPTFEKYEDGWEYCQKVNGLIEPHRELTPFKNISSQWDQDYWIKLKSDLMKNFSKERFEHMINVAKVFYADKIRRLEAERASERHAKEQAAQHEAERKMRAKEQNKEESAIKPVQQVKTDSIQTKQQRERINAEKNAKEQAKYDAQHEAEIKQRTEERKRKEREESTKKLMGAAVVAIVIIVVVAILLLK